KNTDWEGYMDIISIRTDLALESRDFLAETGDTQIEGLVSEEYSSGNIKVTSISIQTEEAGARMEKPRGTYVTLELPPIEDCEPAERAECSRIICSEIRKMVSIDAGTKTLVVGLGNHDITSDALGPKTASGIIVTRHSFIILGREDCSDISDVSVITPGVMGTTGIETVDMIQGIVEKTKPDLVIAIDALASRNVSRITTTIQMCDTGISPGAGVGNNRKGINEDTLGVKVLAIGVPTVINTSSIIYDIVAEYSKRKDVKNNIMLGPVGDAMRNFSQELNRNPESSRRLISMLPENMIVTPGNIDEIISGFASVLSGGINLALHPGLSLEDISNYIN
ncbi:MAG: GPR endopeptidase, partial [Bacillota bacterium]|nr:GPR endopeptidase [Bacillota bacterium]